MGVDLDDLLVVHHHHAVANSFQECPQAQGVLFLLGTLDDKLGTVGEGDFSFILGGRVAGRAGRS